MPAETVVRPVKVLTPDSVTVPLVVLLRAMPEPPRMAPTVPLCSSNVPVLVSTPVLPVMLPLFERMTVPTESLKVPIARTEVAPSTVTSPVLSALLAP